MKCDIDIDHLKTWIGHEALAEDIITPTLLQRFKSTIVGDLTDEDEVPSGLHWCLAPLTEPLSGIGPDGHPTKGGFLPPVPLPRRMWAGGELTFIDSLKVGDSITRHSRIEDVMMKDGRTDPLCFITVCHKIFSRERLCIEERQHIVYREAINGQTGAKPAANSTTEPLPKGDIRLTINVSPIMLFRYSALTFNSHLIHYDRSYAMKVEGYAGLVVHGPLQATILMQMVEKHSQKRLEQFTYRGTAPLVDVFPMEVCVANNEEGSVGCWSGVENIGITMKATATWSKN